MTEKADASVSTAFAGWPSSDDMSGVEASVNSYFAAPATGVHVMVGFFGYDSVAPSVGEIGDVLPTHSFLKLRVLDQGPALPSASTARTCQKYVPFGSAVFQLA